MVGAHATTTRPNKATPTPNAVPVSSPSPRRSDTRQLSPTPAVASLLVVLLALVVQLFAPQLPHAILTRVFLFFDSSHDYASTPPVISLRNPIVVHEQPVCVKPVLHTEFQGTFNTRPERSMALADRAKQVAAEFDFGKDAVNKAVEEFVREMGRWWSFVTSNGC